MWEWALWSICLAIIIFGGLGFAVFIAGPFFFQSLHEEILHAFNDWREFVARCREMPGRR